MQMQPKHSSLPEAIQVSTLEVDPKQDGTAALILWQNPGNEKIVSYDVGIQVVSVDEGLVPVEKAPIAIDEKVQPPLPIEYRRVLGLKLKTFSILLCIIGFLITATAIGGGIGGTFAARRSKLDSSSTLVSNPTSTSVSKSTSTSVSMPTNHILYANRGLAAMQWTDLNGTLHKRVYYQHSSDRIEESAWNNNTTFDAEWQMNSISDAVKPGTPIAAAAGYPHARLNETLVR